MSSPIPHTPILSPTIMYHSKPDDANGIEFMVKYSTVKKRPFIIESHACPYTEEITPMWMGSDAGDDIEMCQHDIQYSLMCHLEDSLETHHAYTPPDILYIVNYKIGVTTSTIKQERSVLERLLAVGDQLLCIHTTISHISSCDEVSSSTPQIHPNIHFIVAYCPRQDIDLDDIVIQIDNRDIYYLDTKDILNTSLSKYRDMYTLFHNKYTQFTMPTDILVTNTCRKTMKKLLSILSVYGIGYTVYTHTVDRPSCHSIMGIQL